MLVVGLQYIVISDDYSVIYRDELLSIFRSHNTFIRWKVVEAIVLGIVGLYMLIGSAIVYIAKKDGYLRKFFAGGALLNLAVTELAEAISRNFPPPMDFIGIRIECVAVLASIIVWRAFTR